MNNTSGRNAIPHLSRKYQMPVLEEHRENWDSFHDNIQDDIKHDRTYKIRVNGKWVYEPKREEKKHKAPEIMFGTFKDSCRSEGSDG